MEKVESKEIKKNTGNKSQALKKEIINKQKREVINKVENDISSKNNKEMVGDKKHSNVAKTSQRVQSGKVDKAKRIESIKKENNVLKNNNQVMANQVHKGETRSRQANKAEGYRTPTSRKQGYETKVNKTQPNKIQQGKIGTNNIQQNEIEINRNKAKIHKNETNPTVAKENISINQPLKNVMVKPQKPQSINKEPVKEINNNIKNENVIDDYQENKPEVILKDNKANKKSKKGLLILILIIVFLILLVTIASTIFGLINKNSEKIISGIKINNIDISNLTKEQAIQKLDSQLNNNENNYITIQYKDYAKQIYLEDIKGKFDVNTAVEDAFNIGRDSDIIRDNYKAIETMIKGENILPVFSYDEELLKNKMKQISLELPDVATDASYIIDGKKLIIKNSKDGVQIKKDEFTQNLVNSFTSSQKSFSLPVEKVERKEIDIDSIHNEVYKAPINATFTTNPYKVNKEENGLDFAISLDEVKKMLLEQKDEYEIPLKEIKPEITVEKLGSKAYPDVLSTFTTTYGTADSNRNANIALAAKSITSVVLMPGEIFSYNDLIGECSTRTGYKPATIYLNGQLSTGIGGGICQVSTTLYNAVLRANLEIVERRNHSLGVTYVPAGQDAMVNIGTSDFKFKNNRDYPIKVVAYTGTGSITCQIQGLKSDTEYEVKLESRTIEKTSTRYKVETYKVLYLNGALVSRTWLSTDTYKYH